MTPPLTIFSRPRTASDGFIIVAVLWILGALATLISIYAVYLVETAATFGAHDDRLRAEALVSAALELTAYRLSLPVEPRLTHGAFSFRLRQANVAVVFRPENARIDLNASPKELLSGLFAELGAHPDDADNYANAVIGWRTAPSKGDASEASNYQKAGRKYAPRGAPFPHVNELSLVLGLPTALVERALPFITIYSGHPQVNAVVAAPQVIAALPGMTRERLNAVLVQREIPAANRQVLMPLLGDSGKYATIDGSKASRVTVRVVFDNGRRMNSEVVILPSEETAEPFLVLSWIDEPDEPQADSRFKASAR